MGLRDLLPPLLEVDGLVLQVVLIPKCNRFLADGEEHDVGLLGPDLHLDHGQLPALLAWLDDVVFVLIGEPDLFGTAHVRHPCNQRIAKVPVRAAGIAAARQAEQQQDAEE